MDSKHVKETFEHVYNGINEEDPFLPSHISNAIQQLKDSFDKHDEHISGNELRERQQNFLLKLVGLLKKAEVLKSSLSSNGALNSQFIFYYGNDGSIHQLRHGTGLMRYPNRKEEVDSENYSSQPSKLVFEGEIEPKSVDISNPSPGFTSKLIGMVKSTYEHTGSLASSFTLSNWNSYNIARFLSDDLLRRVIPVGNPVSHNTINNSQHLFFISYPNYHLNHLYWSMDNRWHFEDMTQVTKGSKRANPNSGLVSYQTSLSQYVFYTDSEGRIHQLSQSLLSSGAKWENLDVTLVIEKQQEIKKISADDPHLISPCVSLLSACILPISKETDAVAIYFKDSIGQLFSLENVNNFSLKSKGKSVEKEDEIYSEWSCRNLFAEKTLSGKLGAIGNEGFISTFTKGIFESISTAATTSGESVISTVKGWTTFGKSETSSKEYELVEQTKSSEPVFARKLRQLKESNEILSSKVVELEIKNADILKLQKENKDNSQELEKVRQEHLTEIENAKKMLQENEEKEKELENAHRQELEELRLRNEALLRQFEEQQELLRKLEKENQKKDRRVETLTGGLGWKVHKQMNRKKVEEQDQREPECSICMDNPPQVEQKCGHKALCEECFALMISQNKNCPICDLPLEINQVE
eukprot:TRINITY_DN4277_c0_g1_i2.p1 TRINITY_DN4277_c0_g1~~TRINITY_DN4277_c0_g1_i2.p1  ORF type:complete len:641 (-),score=234.39 TRINITY_DN4277_c0_g1_i2:1863-3785(-)